MLHLNLCIFLTLQILYEKVNRAVSGADNGPNTMNHKNVKNSGMENSNFTSHDQPHTTCAETGNKTNSSRESPFSARAAIKQTQQILSSTKRTTTSVLSTITDHKWWASAVNSLQGFSQTDQSGRQLGKVGEDGGNVGFKQQGCHPFYTSIMGDCYEDTVGGSW